MGLFAMVRFLTLALFINVVSKVHAIEFSACANNSACNFLVTSDTNNVPAYEILFDFWIYDTNVSGSSEHEKGIFVLQEAQNNIGNPEPIFTAGIKQGNANTLKVGAFDSVMDSSLAVPKNEWIHIGISWKSSTGKLEAVVNGKHWERKLNAGLNRVLSGNTLKEANAINTSLSALGGVIAALTSGAKFIPYRGNKLTEILQDGLGGTAKTLMFVNASPADYNMQETMGSFEFALRCKDIKNEKSAAVVETAEVRELKHRLAEMQSALAANGVKLPGDT